MAGVQPTIINKFGKLTGWNNIIVNMLGRDIEGITELEYNDETEMNNEYGSGGYPQGQSQGNYKAMASITLFSEEIVALQRSVPPGTRLQDIPPFPIVSNYDNAGLFLKDVLNNCRIKTVGKAIKQGDGKITHKCDLLISHIDWNK